MTIAIIAWGSLVWNPGALPYNGDWQPGGPEVSLEFSRVSRDCRLTLVIDGENGVPVSTRFALSKRRNLRDAIADLRDREGTIWNRIGFVDLANEENSSKVFPQPEPTFSTIQAWAKGQKLRAVVWTALPPSFEKETKKSFSVENAAQYVRGLPESARKVAVEYLDKAPAEVCTPLRHHLAQEGIIAPQESWGVT